MSEVERFEMYVSEQAFGRCSMNESDTGKWVKHEDYAALQKQNEINEALLYAMRIDVRESREKMEAILAESLKVRERHNFIRALGISIIEHSGGRMDWRGAMDDAKELVDTINSVYDKTPSTNAIANELRAEGVEMFGSQTIAIGEAENESLVIYAGKQALLFAAQLRAGNVEGGE